MPTNPHNRAPCKDQGALARRAPLRTVSQRTLLGELGEHGAALAIHEAAAHPHLQRAVAAKIEDGWHVWVKAPRPHVERVPEEGLV
eukprot:3732660-Prymnesium_polylepis.2